MTVNGTPEQTILENLLDRAKRLPDVNEDSTEYLWQLALGMVTRAGVTVNRALDAVVRDHDLTYARYQVLSVLYYAVDHQMQQRHIADNLCLHLSSMTGHINRLVKDGLVIRFQRGDDRRTTYIGLTDDGIELYRTARAGITAATETFGDVEPAELKRLSELLQGVIDSSSRLLDSSSKVTEHTP